MRKAGVLLLIISLVAGVIWLFSERSKTVDRIENIDKSTIQEDSPGEKHSYIFIPYWTIDSEISEIPYETLIYFGILAGNKGINKDEDGYNNLGKFNDFAGAKDKLLTIRMLSTQENSIILRSESTQKKIIHDAISIAEENGFRGIVLDLEMQGLPFETLIKRITAFQNDFATSAKKNNLFFGTLLYGDTYYRIRPYNVREIGREADRVFVMAYDFSKSRGDPGPNFPLGSKDTYGYDFESMIESFSKEIPKSKITVVLGMFGYDWEIDSDGKVKGQADSLTTLQFEKMMTRCIDENTCKSENSNSGMKLTYEKDSENHVVWFETNDSSIKKIDFLKSVGINSVAWWAYTFF